MKTPSLLEIPSEIPGLTGYRILFEKQECSLEKSHLPKKEQALFEDLYIKIQENPEKHMESLTQLYHRQPQVPEIANLLTYAFLRLKKQQEAEALIEKTYRDHPNYLIAKINYADQCLRQKKHALIPEIFNGFFDLRLLYPDRESYYFAEFRGFQVVLGFYYLTIGEKQKAEDCYQLAFQVDPLHPSVAALEQKLLETSWLKKCLHALQRLAGISKNP